MSRSFARHVALSTVLIGLCTPALVAHEGESSCRAGKIERAAMRGEAWDDATGRDRRHFPADRLVDHRHLKLELRFEDLEVATFEAIETLEIAAIGAPVSSFTLDAVGLQLRDVRADGHETEWFHDGTRLDVRFDPPLAVDVVTSLHIEYTCANPAGGIYFTPSTPGLPNSAEVHSLGQSIENRHWMAVHDQPNERLTTELIVNVPAAYQAISNGHLVSHLVNGERAIWHWRQDGTHVSYLVSLVIGRFDVVDLEHPRVPMQVWTPLGTADDARATYANTGAMIDVFEQRFGIAYPWERYDHTLVRNFGAGGMEHTSATTMHRHAYLDETGRRDGDIDGLIAHELCHQWTGDLITCKEWAHLWLNEGFATWGEALWFEERDGRDGYFAEVLGNFRVARRDRVDGVAMASNVYDHPDDTFGRRANPYSKGAAVLHMLRMMLGEEVFWPGIRQYVQEHAYGTVETHDLRIALESASGRGLEWFFEQWCRRPGCPDLEVTLGYDVSQRQLKVDVTQLQTATAAVPAFRFALPVHVSTSSGLETHVVEVTERTTSATIELDAPPELVTVDPELHVLAQIAVKKPDGWWPLQAMEGATLPARHRALVQLGSMDTDGTRRVLDAVVRNEAAHSVERRRAVESLGGLATDEAADLLRAMLAESADGSAGIDDPRVRAAIVEALGSRDAPEDTPRLAALATSDPSYAVRVAAIEAIGERKAEDQVDMLLRLTADDPSPDRRIARTAISALSALDRAEALEPAMQYGAFGQTGRTRTSAIGVVGKLAHHEPDRAVPWLIELLQDPERRAVRAAGRALVATGDARALEPLDRMARTHPNEAWRTRAAEWAKELRAKQDGDATKTSSRERERRR